MTRPITRFSLALVVAGTLAACQSYPAPLTPPPGAAVAPAAKAGPQDRRVLLKGRVQWSALRRLMATSASVATNATVTLYNGDTPVAAGLADGTGAFTIYESTEPLDAQAGDVFTLEVTRRGATDGSNTLLSLRTIVQATDGDWTSITGTTIEVSALTTAVCQWEADDDTHTAANMIEKVDGGTLTGFDDATVADIEARAAKVTGLLAQNLDPAQVQPETVFGDVYVSDDDDLADLALVETITGNLVISYDDPTTFELPRLRTVGGTLTVNYVDASDLTGLSSLRSVGSLEILDANLESLAGLEHLTEVNGDLTLQGLGTAFTSLGALEALEYVEGTIEINDAPGLADVDLPALTDLGGLSITDADVLASLAGLDGATFPASDAVIRLTNLPIPDLQGLAGATGHLARLAVDGCTELTSFDGLGDVDAIDELYINQAALEAFDVPSTLTAVDDFTCNSPANDTPDTQPADLSGLANVTIGNFFQISGLTRLTNLDGPKFDTELETFDVNGCTGLTTLATTATEKIELLTTALRVVGNTDLTEFGLVGLDPADDPAKTTIGSGDGPEFVYTGNGAVSDTCLVIDLAASRFGGDTTDTQFTVDDFTDCGY